MKHAKSFLFTILLTGACVSGAHGQGVIGLPYFGLEVGYERLRGIPNTNSLDGIGAGAELNFPMTRGRQEVGLDARAGLDFFRVDGSGHTRHLTMVDAGLRAYSPVQYGLKPYAGVGLGWGRLSDSPQAGPSTTTDTVYFPLEAGIELARGPFSLTPFFRYIVSTDGDFDDFWEAGGKAAYWFNRGMATTVSVTHTDFKGDDRKLGVRVGLLFTF